MSSIPRLLTRPQIAAMTGMGLWWVDKMLRKWRLVDRRFKPIGSNTGRRYRDTDVARMLAGKD